MTDHDMIINLAGGDSEDEILDKEILELQKKSQIYNDVPLNLVQWSDTHKNAFNASTILTKEYTGMSLMTLKVLD